MEKVKVVQERKPNIKIIKSTNQNDFITKNDAEMDARAKQAVKAAIDKAKFCKKPIAKYDTKTGKAYMEYPDGRKVYVR